MIVSVDLTSPVPVFEQLRSQIELQILAGQLRPGHQLPAIRHLAADLGLARGTVAKVYEALVRDGLVTAAGRHGTVVAYRHNEEQEAQAKIVLNAAVEQLVLLSRQLGISAIETHLALDQAFAAVT
ncbi:MAG: GntR family transcriptional regulator [Propionibacteriaceae bacterium]|nr:GntR family transcriptional regulator [Propionibacteriaceae bacterium]